MLQVNMLRGSVEELSGGPAGAAPPLLPPLLPAEDFNWT